MLAPRSFLLFFSGRMLAPRSFPLAQADGGTRPYDLAPRT
jgi:hypothetical protein